MTAELSTVLRPVVVPGPVENVENVEAVEAVEAVEEAPRPLADPNAAPVREPGVPSRAGNAMSRTRAGILRGAARCLVRYGTRKTTMGDIAREGGVAKATLYNHFRTKADVYAALLDAEVDAVLDEIAGVPLPDAAIIAARRIAEHPVLRAIATREPELAVLLTVPSDTPVWRRVRTAVAAGPDTLDIVLRWVLSHVLWPASPPSIEAAARALFTRLADSTGLVTSPAPL